MNDYTAPTGSNSQTDAPEGKVKKGHRRWIIPTSVGMVALFMGVGIGGSGSSEEATAAEPEPAPTVTETAEPEPAPTVTETAEPEVETITEEVEVEKEVTPQACLDALDTADQIIAWASEGFGYAADGMMAAIEYDAAGLDIATENLNGITANVEAETTGFIADSADCRSK